MSKREIVKVEIIRTKEGETLEDTCRRIAYEDFEVGNDEKAFLEEVGAYTFADLIDENAIDVNYYFTCEKNNIVFRFVSIEDVSKKEILEIFPDYTFHKPIEEEGIDCDSIINPDNENEIIAVFTSNLRHDDVCGGVFSLVSETEGL